MDEFQERSIIEQCAVFILTVFSVSALTKDLRPGRSLLFPSSYKGVVNGSTELGMREKLNNNIVKYHLACDDFYICSSCCRVI